MTISETSSHVAVLKAVLPSVPVPSDYQYLSEHFRESHYLCEEGRCATAQFTHAFRSEIDYKAHKASAHSKNRAEARQNRQIDLQFTYAPRTQRRNEGERPVGVSCCVVLSFYLTGRSPIEILKCLSQGSPGAKGTQVTQKR